MTEKTRSITWKDLERLRVKDLESDPESLFSESPTLKTERVKDLEDSESLSLFYTYGRKLNRLSKSDRRLSGLRVSY